MEIETVKDVSQQLAEDRAQQEEQFFQETYERLDDINSYLNESDPENKLLKLNRSHPEEIVKFLRGNRASSKLIQSFFHGVLTRC